MVRRGICVPMIALCLLLCGCGGEKTDPAETLRQTYRDMGGSTMEAQVICGAGSDEILSFTMKCDYVPDGACTIEVTAPETVAGVKAVVDGLTLKLEYDGECLNTGTLSAENISPAACLPQLMNALRDGWLLEENEEDWNEIPCLRMAFDQTGKSGNKIVSTVFLRQEDGTPVYGEIAVDDEIILQAEFTNFQFGDILTN